MPRHALGVVSALVISPLVFAGVLASTIVPSPVLAQDSHRPDGWRGEGHSENHDWYQQLKQPGTGYSCCNGTLDGVEGDCRPTRAYLNDDGQWYAQINGRWVPVPPRVVLQQLAPDGRSHICASKSGMIYCFLGGSPRS